MSSPPVEKPPLIRAEPRAPTVLTGVQVQRLARPSISTSVALDAAFSGQRCEFVRADGTSTLVAVNRWDRDACATDLDLFVDACVGLTLDVGCGPGRLSAALSDRRLPALGIDISREAVRRTRERGAVALRQDVFDPLPGLGAWQHVLLADGNIGLGGDPVRLLRRIAELLTADGSAVVELSGPGVGSVYEKVRLRVGRHMSHPFTWATVGLEDIDVVANAASLRVSDVRCVALRYVATLHPRPGAPLSSPRRTD